MAARVAATPSRVALQPGPGRDLRAFPDEGQAGKGPWLGLSLGRRSHGVGASGLLPDGRYLYPGRKLRGSFAFGQLSRVHEI